MDIFLLIVIYSSLLMSADFNIDDFFLDDIKSYNLAPNFINERNERDEKNEIKDMPCKVITTPIYLDENILPPIHNFINQDSVNPLKRKRKEKEFPKLGICKSPIFDALIILAHYEDSGVSFIGPEENGHLQIDDEHKLFINTNNMIAKKSPTNCVKSRRKTYAQKFIISNNKNKILLILLIKDSYNYWYQEKLRYLRVYKL